MPIYDNNGTTNYRIGEIYDNNGTTNTIMKAVYDNNGTTNTQVYTRILRIFDGSWHNQNIYPIQKLDVTETNSVLLAKGYFPGIWTSTAAPGGFSKISIECRSANGFGCPIRYGTHNQQGSLPTLIETGANVWTSSDFSLSNTVVIISINATAGIFFGGIGVKPPPGGFGTLASMYINKIWLE